MNTKRFLFSTIFGLFVITASWAQCKTEDWVNACIPKLSGDFTFLKSYQIDGDGGSKNAVEYSYVFTKDTQYMINLCTGDDGADGIVITLFDADRKKLASSMVNGQFISAIAFNCKKTGIYYITYSFENSDKFCGGSALGFKRSAN